MQFRDLQLQDLPAVQQLADQTESLASDASFATMFIWKDQTHDLFCLRDGFLFRRGVADRRLRYIFRSVPGTSALRWMPFAPMRRKPAGFRNLTS